MKNYCHKIRYIFILLIVFVSCNSSKEKSLILSDKMLKKNPVQALAILDSLENKSKLDEEEELHLIWNRALAQQHGFHRCHDGGLEPLPVGGADRQGGQPP